MKEVELFVQKMMTVFFGIDNDFDLEKYDEMMASRDPQAFISWINTYYENLTK
jgi:hypothetical protein